ncbi:hypothetical protein AX14_002715 [Amanita brunnescens Koide BX004]|nr:hypothetical protein AX14_002715 [Amanita brunnescens Koide BX004]
MQLEVISNSDYEVGPMSGMASRSLSDHGPAADLSSELLKPLALLWLQQLEPTLTIDPESIVGDVVQRNQITTDVPGHIPSPGSVFVFERSLIPRWTDAGYFPYNHHLKVGKYDSVVYHGCTSDRLRLDPLLRINIHNIPYGGRDYELVMFLLNPNFVEDHIPLALVRLTETLAHEFGATPQDVLTSIRQHAETMTRNRTNG